MEEIKPVQVVKLKSLLDLAKLLVSSLREPMPVSILHHEKNGKHVFSATQVLTSYYELKGLPLTFYAEYDGEEEVKSFIAYKAGEEKEEIKFTDELKDLSYRYLAVINVEEFPEALLPIFK